MHKFFTDDEMLDFSHDIATKLRRYWLRNYIDNFPRIMNDKTIANLPNLGFGKPVAVLGGAPIARESYDILRELKVTTVCCDKTLPQILPHYRPDIVTAVNTQKTEAVELEEWFDDTEGMKLVVPATVHPDTVKLWKGEVYWTNPTNIDDDIQMRIQQETGLVPVHRGINVGEFSLLVAGFLCPAEIDLFGMWYAWKTRKEVIDPQGEDYSCVELVNEGEKWYTSLMWAASRSAFLEHCKAFMMQGIEVYNCSMGGILYHPEYCKISTPQEMKERWSDV